ncbi:hypothetical protein TWF718_007089 [Orbilia javanica]|uniref:Myb-like domain-containing protein n=1 Tax=Orbilia javanica TaxID=47235 RepID=A0AAN8RDL0_9PEZI
MDTMDPNSKDQNEQEEVPEIPPTDEVEDEDEENTMEEEQPEGLELAQEDEEEEPAPPQEPVKESKKPKEKKGKGAGRPKKSEKAKEPPVKKRKRSEDKEDQENRSNNEIKKESSPESGEVKTGKGSGRGRKKGESGEAWTESTDKILLNIIKRHTGGTAEGIPWKETMADFQEACPEAQKTLKALQMRWQNHLKHSIVELTEEQTAHFKQAVKDINGSEKNAAIAWRYKQLSNHELNKGTVTKLLKTLGLS